VCAWRSKGAVDGDEWESATRKTTFGKGMLCADADFFSFTDSYTLIALELYHMTFLRIGSPTKTSSSSCRSTRSTPQISVPVEPVLRPPLTAWADDGFNAKTYSSDAYIASHVWDCHDYKVETFGESPAGDDVQARLQTFLERDPASWSDQPKTRKAKWSESSSPNSTFCASSLAVEVVGLVGKDGDRPAWLQTLCKRLESVA
jgi:hypothetical protein